MNLKTIIKIFGWMFIVSGVLKLIESLVYLIVGTALLEILVTVNLDMISFEKLILFLAPFTLNAFSFLNLFWHIFGFSELGLSLLFCVQAITLLVFGYVLLTNKTKYFKYLLIVLTVDLIMGTINISFGIFFPAFLRSYIENNIVWFVADIFVITTLFKERKILNYA